MTRYTTTVDSKLPHRVVKRTFLKIPLEEAHLNHPVGPISAMASKRIKKEIQDQISEIVSDGNSFLLLII